MLFRSQKHIVSIVGIRRMVNSCKLGFAKGPKPQSLKMRMHKQMSPRAYRINSHHLARIVSKSRVPLIVE